MSTPQQPKLRFFSNPRSRARMVRWMLEECGATYNTVLLDYGTTIKAPEYLAINPMGKVPAIQHGDTVVTENAAILLYLADLVPEKKLAPPVGTPARGPYYRWIAFMAPLEAMLTAKSAEIDKVVGLEIGADDYVSKPFSLLNVAQVIHDNITHAQTSPANTNAQEGMPGQTPSPSMEPKLLNEEDALARFSGNATLWNKITHQALLDIPPRLDELMAEGSLPLQRIQDQLHSIKGVASTVGWEQLQYACAALENGLKAIPWNPNTHGARLMEIWRQSARAARELLTPVVVQRDVARAKELLLELLTLMDNNDPKSR